VPMETEGAAAPLLFLIYFSESSFFPQHSNAPRRGHVRGQRFPTRPRKRRAHVGSVALALRLVVSRRRNVFSLSAFHEPQPVVEVEAAAPTPPVPPRDSFAPSTASV